MLCGKIFLLILCLFYGLRVQNLFVQPLAKQEINWSLAREYLEQDIAELCYALTCMFSTMHMHVSPVHFFI